MFIFNYLFIIKYLYKLFAKIVFKNKKNFADLTKTYKNNFADLIKINKKNFADVTKTYKKNFANIYKFIIINILLFSISCNNTFFYYPTHRTYYLPENFKIKYDENFLSGVDGNTIHTWLLYPEKNKKTKATIIHFHGNAQNMTIHYTSMFWLLDNGFEVFTFDYRGYGRSEGKVDTKKIIADSKLLIKYIQNRNRKKNLPIIIWGQSLGGAISARTLGELENRENIKGLVIESSFHSWKSIASKVGEKICYTISGIGKSVITDEYASTKFLTKISPISVLVLHGTSDEVIPFSQGVSVFENASEPKFFVSLLGAGHLNWQFNKTFDNDKNKIIKLINSFVKKY